MFLKKAAIITLSTLFLTMGCVSTSTPEPKVEIINVEQTAKIMALESELIESKATLAQNELTLQQVEQDLITSQQQTASLNQRLEQKIENEKETKKTETVNTVVVEKTSKKESYLDKTVLGQSEWIYISSAKESFEARIDTGAATSSINAVDIQRFERDGKKWVRFNITHEENSENKMIEAKIVRIVKIIQSGKPGEDTERPVIRLHVRIGDISNQTEFTLTDRLHMKYPVLIGRSFMQDVVLVDVSQEYIQPKLEVDDRK